MKAAPWQTKNRGKLSWEWTDYATSAIIFGVYCLLIAVYCYVRKSKRPVKKSAVLQ